MNRKYTTIVFDLGNVLIPFDHQIWVKNYNKIEDGLGNKYLRLYLENYNIHRNFEAGKITEAEFVKYNLEWLKNKITQDEFFHYFSDIFKTNDEVIKLLPILKKKYKLVLLSNTNSIHKKYGWGKYSFLDFFDKLVLSHEVGFVKPDEGIYKSVEDFTKEPSETHLFIDDVLEYVNTAINLGWDAIQFIGYKNLLEEFTKRKIL